MSPYIIPIPIDDDNYSYLIIVGNQAIIVDACSSAPIEKALVEYNCTAALILSTHHHHDHTGGNCILSKRFNCPVIGGDQRIPGLTHQCTDGEQLAAPFYKITCISTPGHTTGSFTFYLEDLAALFTGDMLFYGGCGRCFEDSPAQLYASVNKIKAMPAATLMYAGHEYTLGNLAFARSVEPDNRSIVERMIRVDRILGQCGTYGPATIAEECATNPFLRCDEPSVCKHIGMTGMPEEMVFTELRKRKNSFSQ